jgi:O-antigen/teichoic acid export membrane protein
MNLQNKNALFNILGPIILNGINFFTIPIYTRVLGAEQYGLVSVFNTWVGIFSIVFGLQVQGSIGTATVRIGNSNLKEYLSSILCLGLLFSLFCLLGWLIFLHPISNALLLAMPVVVCIAVQSISLFIINFSVLSFTFNKCAEKSFAVNVITAACTTILSLILLFFVFSGEDLYLGRIYGQVIPTSLIAALLAFYFLREGHFAFKKEYVLFCLPICLPLVFHGLSHIILAQSDRVMIQHMINNRATGIYSFVVTFSNVLNVIWGALNNTWVPFYYDDLKKKEYNHIADKTKSYLLNYSIIVIVFLFWAPEVIKLFVPSPFWEAIGLLPYFVMSAYFVFLYSFPVNFEFYNKKTYSIAIGTVSAALVNIGLNYLLIPILGMTGAALATLIAHIVLFLFHDCIARYLLPEHYHYSLTAFIPYLAITILFVVIYKVIFSFTIVRWGIGMLLSLAFLFHLWKRKNVF